MSVVQNLRRRRSSLKSFFFPAQLKMSLLTNYDYNFSFPPIHELSSGPNEQIR